MSYFISTITQNYANFNGRARRKEYWMFVLFNMIAAVLLAVLASVTGISFIPVIYSLIVLLPGFAVSVRRLHDINKSGIWLLISLIPLIGGIWLLILMCKEGTPGTNEYGGDPK